MPHLHLPAAHSDADLALAADVAAAVGSEDLYVAWSHAEGPGLAPEVQAVVRPPRETSAIGELFASALQSLAALVGALVRGPVARPALPAPRGEAQAAGEPSA